MSIQDNKHKIKTLTEEELALEQDNLAIINLIYPIGVVIFFADKVDPNLFFHGKTEWAYIGENKTIRIAKADGSNIKQTGGTDIIKLSSAQLPPHEHAFTATATTSPFDYGTVSTYYDGYHTHMAPLGFPEGANPFWGYGNSTNDIIYSRNEEMVTGTPVQTSTDGGHKHDVEVGAHQHTVSVHGTTQNIGNGAAIDITNSYIMLMGWIRTA